MSEARYSQPLAARPREALPIVFAGFVGDHEAGFIVRNRQGKRIQQEVADSSNEAREHPGGFGAALGRLWAWASGGKP
jgi:hypothetical protein